MPSVVEGFLAVAAAVGQIATTGKLAAATLTEAAEAAKEYTAAAKEAAATTSGMTKASSGGGGMGSSSGSSGSSGSTIQNSSPSGSLSIETGDLGDTRNAEEQMARMIASIEAAKRR